MKTTWMAVYLPLLLSLLCPGCGKKVEEAGKIGRPETFIGTIDVMSPGGYYTDFLKNSIIPAFNREYPNVKVMLSADANLDTRIGANDPPSIYAGIYGYPQVKFAKMDRIVDMKMFPDHMELFKRINPNYYKEIFNGYYSVPWNVTTSVMIYNKELFRKAGLDPDKPPMTTGEFLEYARRINNLPPDKDNGKIYGNVLWNDALTWGAWYWEALAPMYYTMNQGRYQLLNREETTIVFNRPEAKMKEFLEFMSGAQQYAPLDMTRNFFTRTIGMWLQFEYGWKANFKDAAGYPMVIGKDVGIAPIPVPVEGGVSYSSLNGRALMIFKSSPDKVAISWEFIKFLMRDENQLAACRILNVLPTLTTVEMNDYFKAPDIRVFMEQLKHSYPPQSSSLSDKIQNIVLKMYSECVVMKTKTVDQAMSGAINKSIELFKKEQN